jgi:hypothetical protein
MKRVIRFAVFAFVVYCFWSIFIGIKESIESEGIVEDIEYPLCDEFSAIDSLDDEVNVKHLRSWNKYTFDSTFCLSYTVSSKYISPSNKFRNQLYTRERNYENYWRNIYYELYQHDNELISFLKDSLQLIADTNSLSRKEVAYLIVSFVQDIPYNYVASGPCDRHDHPCRANEKFGILSPVEFLYTLSGDCDTRSVLLYSVLKHFGFDPLIMISNQYRHAMIAIDLPASGDHIIHKGKKFYFWETTNTGWLPGMLPPDVNNIAYWKITLDHEYQTLASRNH